MVAEGVETAADAATLRTLAVDHGQGWLFGPATAAEELRDEYPFGGAETPGVAQQAAHGADKNQGGGTAPGGRV